MNTPDLFGHRAEPTPPPPPARMAPKPPPKRVTMSEETKAKLAASRPSMTDRDHSICAQSTAFSQMTGSRLANALRDQLLILSDIRWSTLSPFQRADLLALTEAMARRIKSAEAEPEGVADAPPVSTFQANETPTLAETIPHKQNDSPTVADHATPSPSMGLFE